MVQVINAFGRGCTHSIVVAEQCGTNAVPGIDRGIVVDPATDFPSLQGRPTPGRLQRLAHAMQGHDLILTYGYGAIDAAMAHTMFGSRLPLPPLVHHETGDEEAGRRTARNWYRRIALGRAAALVVPSPRLETIAIDSWHQPRWRVRCVAPGIRTAAYVAKPRRDALPRVIKRDGELWLGMYADPTPAGDPARLVRAFAMLPEPWHLVVLGEDPQRGAISDEALRLELGHRVHWPGAVAQPALAFALFDLFALSPGSARGPVALVEAMAAGLAVAASAAGDIAAMLSPENRPFVTAAGDDPGLVAALQALAGDIPLRSRVGAANRALARAQYDEAGMVAAYREVYAAALGQKTFP